MLRVGIEENSSNILVDGVVDVEPGSESVSKAVSQVVNDIVSKVSEGFRVRKSMPIDIPCGGKGRRSGSVASSEESCSSVILVGQRDVTKMLSWAVEYESSICVRDGVSSSFRSTGLGRLMAERKCSKGRVMS